MTDDDEDIEQAKRRHPSQTPPGTHPVEIFGPQFKPHLHLITGGLGDDDGGD